MRTPLNKSQLIAVLANCYVLIRDRWAQKMSALTRGRCKRDMILLLAAFVLLSTSLNLLIVYSSFKKKPTESVSLPPMAKMLTIAQGTDSVLQRSAISEQKHNTMMDLKMSLKGKDSAAIALYDSLWIWRPGLLDSLVCIGNYDKSNVKESNDGK